MIKRKEDILPREAKNAQGGKDSVFFYDFLTKEESYEAGRVFAKLVVPPGASIGVHEHHGEFEAIYILDGQATITDGDEIVTLNPGDMNLCKDGSCHGLENRTDKDLTAIALIINVPKA